MRLEEDSAVITVSPNVTVGPRSGFLVADFGESQVRRYDSVGRLVHHFGHGGVSAGSFGTPLTSAVLLSSGATFLTEFNGQVAQLDSTFQALSEFTSTGLLPLYTSSALSDSEVVLGGRVSALRDEQLSPLIHIYNVKSHRITRSFFTAPIDRSLAPAAATLGVVAAAIHADTIAAVFALTDTIYLFDRDGKVLDRIRIPFKYFSYIKKGSPGGDDVAARERWLREISMITNLYWLRSGQFVLQVYLDDSPRKEFSLLIMDRHGLVRVEIQGSPQLFAIDDRGPFPKLYFASEGKEAQRRWNIAELPGR